MSDSSITNSSWLSSHTFWTAAEDQALRDGARELSGRSASAVRTRRIRLGLSVGSKLVHFWTENEDQALRDGVRELPNRTKASINARCFKLGLPQGIDDSRRWKEDEVKFIVDNRLSMTYLEIGRQINRSENAVSVKLAKLGLSGDRTQADWALRGPDNPKWKGGSYLPSSGYGRNWSRIIRSKVFARDNWLCVLCFSDNITCHHIVPYRETQDHSILNQVTLCKSCHKLVEDYLDRSLMLEAVRLMCYDKVRSWFLCEMAGAARTTFM